jgi:hypothetical protein
VAHVAEHRGLYQAWLAASPSFHAEALDALAAQVRRVITLAAGSPRDVPAETEALYMAGGMLAVLRHWVQGDLPGTASDITDRILALRPSRAATPDPDTSRADHAGQTEE